MSHSDFSDPQAFLTTAQAAAYVSRSPRTLEGYRSRGVGPRYHRRDGRVVYRRSDLDAWDITAWARHVACEAPPLTAMQAADVARILRGGASA